MFSLKYKMEANMAAILADIIGRQDYYKML